MITDISITDEGEVYIVRCTFDRTTLSDAPSPQIICIPKAAIDNRRQFYGCDSDEDAVCCILKEHYCRLNGFEQLPPVHPETGRTRAWKELTCTERRQAMKVDIPIPISNFELPSRQTRKAT